MQKKNKPLVSIITPVWETDSLLYETAESILSQSYINYEWILVNDHSSKTTSDIITELTLKDNRIKAFNNPQKGAPSARNFGFSKSKGLYVKFLDADDMIESNLIRDQLLCIESSGRSTCLSPIRNLQQTKKKQKLSPPILPHTYTNDLLLHQLSFGTRHPGALLFKREIIELVGGWNESLHSDQDGDLVYRIGLIDNIFSWCAASNSIYRDHNFIDRISKGVTKDKLLSKLLVLCNVSDSLLEAGNIEPYRKIIAYRFDVLLRLSTQGFPEIGKVACRYKKNLGYPNICSGPFSLRIMRKLTGLSFSEKARVLIMK